MAIKLPDGTYGCLFCEKTFTEALKAQSHQDTEHDYVLVPMLKTELKLLVHYLQISVSSEPSLEKGDLLSRDLYRRMKKLAENITQNS